MKVFYDLTQTVGRRIAKLAPQNLPEIEQATSGITGAPISPSQLAEAYRGYHNITPGKLFKSLEEFTKSIRARLVDYKGSVPENLYNAVEKSAAENNFEFSKIIKEYYSKLNSCKTMKEVEELYPEFKGIHLDPQSELQATFKSMLPQNICLKAQSMNTDSEKMHFLMSYFDKQISKQAKSWTAYPELLNCQRQVAQEVISGTYKGNVTIANSSGTIFFNNPQMPIRYNFLGTENVDKLLINLLKQIHLEGKSVQEAVITTAKGKKISAASLYKMDLQFTDKNISNFKKFLAYAEKNVKEFTMLGNISKEQLNSAVLTRTWTKSRLRQDFGNETKFGKGWSNIKNILHKIKHPDKASYTSEKIVDAYLLQQYKLSRTPKGGNPFGKYEQIDKNVFITIRNFVNSCFRNIKISPEERRILSSQGFKEFKEQYDVQGMIKSWENIEEHYKNIFFKKFWTPERVTRFKTALNESYDLAEKNIEISEDFLSKAMIGAIE